MLPFSLSDHRAKSGRLDSAATDRAHRYARRLRLVPRGDGWSLVDGDGELTFSATGLSGRRRCLEFARAQGVITLNR